MSILILIFFCMALGYYFRDISDKAWEAHRLLNDKVEEKIAEIQCGPYLFELKVKLVNNFFNFVDISDPGNREVSVEFASLKSFTTEMIGYIGRDIGRNSLLTSQWVHDGVLVVKKINIDLFDGSVKLEYAPRFSKKPGDGRKMLGFYNPHYRLATLVDGKYYFIYIRNGIASRDEEEFRLINKNRNDLDIITFFEDEHPENFSSYDPKKIYKEGKKIFEKYKGLYQYYLDHPEMGLRRVK